MKIFILILMLFTTTRVFAGGNELFASVISATSFDKSLPYVIFEGKKWNISKGSGYSRLDILFDKPQKIKGLLIEFENEIKDYVTIYLNDIDYTYYLSPKDKKFEITIDEKREWNSLKFNFNRNKEVVVKKIEIYDEQDEPYKIKTPKIVNGSIKATSTLSPERSYNIYKIFDSKLEDGWSSDKKMTGDVIEFNFEEPQTIKAIKLWNGYQRSDVHYKSNSRVKTLKLEGDNGYVETISIKDKLGDQLINLPKSFKGNHLKMTVVDSYPGTVYKDLVISEMRFFDGDKYFFINPIKFLKDNIEYNKNEFSKASINQVLDNQISSSSWSEGENFTGYTFRFRSDGSIYIQGEKTEGETARKFFAIGNYEILKASGEGIDLRLFGYIVEQKGTGTFYEGDCGGGGYEYEYKDATKKIFTEYITITPDMGNGGYTIKNTSKKPNFFFKEISCFLN